MPITNAPLTEKEWRALEQLILIARAMNGSWEETYVQVDAVTLMRVMRAAGWVPKK